MSQRKTIFLDWGCYKVRVQYVPEDINNFMVFYDSPGFEWHNQKYRKLTKPEIRAALEAIYKNEEMKIMPVVVNSGRDGEVGKFEKFGPDNRPLPSAGPTPMRGWRDHVADQVMRALLNNVKSTYIPEATRKRIARDSYAMADEMMQVREPVVEKCSECGKVK